MAEELRRRAAHVFKDVQAHICSALEKIDGKQRFKSDHWQRTDITGAPGGGGDTRILADGGVFEKAGVNFSEVHGQISAEFAAKLTGEKEQLPFFATGVSLVIHPWSPMVPTTHANWRYLEISTKAWFGGGSDLTPYYLFAEDAVHFHTVLKSVCDRHDASFYPRFKKWCDEYFFLPHRGEARGIGGIFYDHLGKDDGLDHEKLLNLGKDLGTAFTDQYIPIVERRMSADYTPEQKTFQLNRRGRYVEFNLLYDRGTHFGLQTGGRVESILMSLPAQVRWDYGLSYPDGSPEALLVETLKKPRAWV